jgi:hypothetical protein
VIVALRPQDAAAVAARIADVAAETLAGYKRPRLFVHAARLPRDPTGKLLRAPLRDSVARLCSPEGDGTLTRINLDHPDEAGPPPTSIATKAIASTGKGQNK